MSLKNIDLDPFLLAQLFRTDLVPFEKATETEEVRNWIPHLGENLSNVTILLQEEQHPFLSDTLYDFLSKILQACHLSIADVALVNTARIPGINLSEITNQFGTKHLILLGMIFQNWIGENLEKYQVRKNASLSVLLADDLKTIRKDKEAKKELWVGLQFLFNLQ